jgi:hypothetical protein
MSVSSSDTFEAAAVGDESAKKSGSGCPWTETWIPLPERSFQFIIGDLGARLEQEMSSPQRPLHLLLFREPPADNLVNRRFDERIAYPFSLPPSIAEVRDELAVVLDVNLEVCHSVRYFCAWN